MPTACHSRQAGTSPSPGSEPSVTTTNGCRGAAVGSVAPCPPALRAASTAESGEQPAGAGGFALAAAPAAAGWAETGGAEAGPAPASDNGESDSDDASASGRGCQKSPHTTLAGQKSAGRRTAAGQPYTSLAAGAGTGAGAGAGGACCIAASLARGGARDLRSAVFASRSNSWRRAGSPSACAQCSNSGHPTLRARNSVWRPNRAHIRLSLPQLGRAVEGMGYADTATNGVFAAAAAHAAGRAKRLAQTTRRGRAPVCAPDAGPRGLSVGPAGQAGKPSGLREPSGLCELSAAKHRTTAAASAWSSRAACSAARHSSSSSGTHKPLARGEAPPSPLAPRCARELLTGSALVAHI